MAKTGDVVIAAFPGAKLTKNRPAVVLSSSTYHSIRPGVIVGILTSRIDCATKATDRVLSDWHSANLRVPSAFRCYLAMVAATDIHSNIGRLSEQDWKAIRRCLDLALGA